MANRHKLLAEPALIVGTGKLGVKISELLREHSELGMQPVGFIDSPDAAPASSLPLLGEMSELPDIASMYDVRRIIVAFPAECDDALDDRHRVNGGMTGWAQVHGLTGDTSIHDRTRFDNNYIEHWSLWLDLVILVRTLTEPLTGIRKHKRGT